MNDECFVKLAVTLRNDAPEEFDAACHERSLIPSLWITTYAPDDSWVDSRFSKRNLNLFLTGLVIPMGRIQTIDGLRGYFIVFMLINHLTFTGGYMLLYFNHAQLGFVEDAQGFVFLSGLLAGMVYTRKMVRGRVRGRCAGIVAALGRTLRLCDRLHSDDPRAARTAAECSSHLGSVARRDRQGRRRRASGGRAAALPGDLPRHPAAVHRLHARRSGRHLAGPPRQMACRHDGIAAHLVRGADRTQPAARRRHQ